MFGLSPDRLRFYLAAGAVATTALSLLGVHWVVTVLALVCVSALAAIWPTVVVAGVVASVPFQSLVMLPFVRGSITVTQLVLFGLIIGWGAIFWRRRIWLDSVVVGFVFVIAAYTLSFVETDVPSLWFQETYRWAIAGVFYIICRSVITTWQHVRWMFWAMTAGVIGLSVHSLIQLVTGAAPADFFVGGTLRVYATFGTPNTLAAYLEMTVPILLACIPIAFWGSHKDLLSPTEKWVYVGAIGLGMLTIGLTQSRGGWIGIAAASFILWIQLPNRIRWVSAAGAVLILGGFLLTSPGRSQLSRFSDPFETSPERVQLNQSAEFNQSIGRGSLWGAARAMIEDKPLTGIGAGEFDEHYREYTPSWLNRFPRGQAHNVWLQMGAQAGVPGVIAYASWFFASVWSILTARRRASDTARHWIITGVLAVFVAYTLHSMVDYLNALSMGLQLSAITAIALNLAPEPLTRYERKPTSSAVITNLEPTPCP